MASHPFVSLCLCCTYIALSSILINFNKFMMDSQRFPFAFMLTTLHTANSWLCCLALYYVAPKLFPSMQAVEGRKKQILTYFGPIAALFVTGVVCSNYAYLYCSVAFLQFMKQTNVAWVFLLSCMIGSQAFDRSKLATITVIVCGTTMAVHGELHFVLQGFLIQALSQFGECGKNIMQEWILSGGDVKLDPLTYNLFMAPTSLLILVLGNILFPNKAALSQVFVWWHYLLPNAMCAFFLNVSIALLIKHTSAMTFMICGVIKDILIVISSTYMFGDSLSHQQVFGFSLTTCGILLWSLAKLQPEHPIVRAFSAALCMDSMDSGRDAAEKENAKQEEMCALLSNIDEDI